MSRSFTEIASPKRGRTKGCPRCGAKPNVGQVAIVARKLGEQGTMNGSEQVASRAVSLCESCTVEVYAALASLVSSMVDDQQASA